MEFGQAYCKDLLKWNPRKFILYFFSFIAFSMNFGTIKKFLEKISEKWKLMNSGGPKPAHGQGGMRAHASWQAERMP
jgi:hypothetical protein